MSKLTGFNLDKGRSPVRSPAWPIFLRRTGDGHCDRIHSSPTTVCCLDNGYVVKQPVGWKEYCAEYWLFPKQALDFTCLQYKSFEKTMENGQIACNEQFLLFP